MQLTEFSDSNHKTFFLKLVSFLLYYFEISIFGEDPKNFLKALLAPIYTSFEGGARAEKTQFFGLNFPKSAFFWLVFLKFCLRRRKFGHNRNKTVPRESSKNQFGRSKKKVDKIFENFLKIRPPRESPRSAPAPATVLVKCFDSR